MAGGRPGKADLEKTPLQSPYQNIEDGPPREINQALLRRGDLPGRTKMDLAVHREISIELCRLQHLLRCFLRIFVLEGTGFSGDGRVVTTHNRHAYRMTNVFELSNILLKSKDIPRVE